MTYALLKYNKIRISTANTHNIIAKFVRVVRVA